LWQILKSRQMKLQRVRLSFRLFTDADFLTKAEFILISMTGNASFPTPVPVLADVETAVAAYSDALNAAEGLGRVNVAWKNKTRTDLETILIQLGMYVMSVANGDAAMLTSSGFTLTKAPEPRYITNPGNVTLSNGVTSGELTDAVASVRGARIYYHEITDTAPTEETVWVRNQSSRSKYVFTGLTPGKQYWVRVAAVGSGEQIAYSNVAAKFVQ
jgi:hypothetical protein